MTTLQELVDATVIEARCKERSRWSGLLLGQASILRRRARSQEDLTENGVVGSVERLEYAKRRLIRCRARALAFEQAADAMSRDDTYILNNCEEDPTEDSSESQP